MSDLDKKLDSKTPPAVAPLTGTLFTAGVSRRQILKAALIGVGGLAAAAGRLGQLYGPLLAQTSRAATTLQSIQMVDAMTGWAMTDQPDASAMLLTPDGGIHWIDVTPLNSSGQRISVDYAAVLNSLVAWLASSDTAAGFPTGTTQIFHTDDGQTWGQVAVPALSAKSIHFINPLAGWLLAEEADGSGMGREAVNIYRSADGGATWIKVAGTSANNQSCGLPLAGAKMAITFRDASTGWITGGGLVSDQLVAVVYSSRVQKKLGQMCS